MTLVFILCLMAHIFALSLILTVVYEYRNMKSKKNATPESLVKVRNIVWFSLKDGKGMCANTVIGTYYYEYVPEVGKHISKCVGVDGQQLWYKEYNLEESAKHACQDHYKRTILNLLEVK